MLVIIIILSLLFVTPVEASESTGIIFIGDSRTVGISNSVEAEDNVFFVAEVGKGYDWFCESAIDEVNTIINENNFINWKIVTNLGVNDLANVDKYKVKYNELINGEWNSYDLYIVSVTCVDESIYLGSATNKRIEDFNMSMSWYRKYIDIFDISKQEIISSDGLHYTKSVYKKLYSVIINNLETD